jgi:HlyD family secretion protein
LETEEMPTDGTIAPESEKEIAIQRSELMQDIVSSRPDWAVRHGNLAFLLVFILIVVATWFIQYPDVIKTKATLTSINAPKPVISTIGGKLIKLNIIESQTVNKGQILGFIESTAIHQDVLKLSCEIDTLQMLLDKGRSEDIRSHFNRSTPALGELQVDYQLFSQAFLAFNNYLSGGFYLTKKKLLWQDRDNLLQLHQNLIEQRQMQEQDLSLTQKTFEANESLKNDKVISDFDYRLEQSKLIGKKLTLPQIRSEIISNESRQTEKEKEIIELENIIDQQKAIFQQSLNTFKTRVDDWIKKYTLIAPVSGKVAFASFIQENQQLLVNQTLCFVNPQNSTYFAEIPIPQTNFGKVHIGQQVLLKFQSYPFQEYGAVIGQIEFISHIPAENGYLAKIIFTNGLETTYHKHIQYRDGLTAEAEVITENMRLLERFYYSIIKQIKT